MGSLSLVGRGCLIVSSANKNEVKDVGCLKHGGRARELVEREWGRFGELGIWRRCWRINSHLAALVKQKVICLSVSDRFLLTFPAEIQDIQLDAEYAHTSSLIAHGPCPQQVNCIDADANAFYNTAFLCEAIANR